MSDGTPGPRQTSHPALLAAGSVGSSATPSALSTSHRTPAFRTVEFLTLSSDADPQRHAHGNDGCQGTWRTGLLVIRKISNESRLCHRQQWLFHADDRVLRALF